MQAPLNVFAYASRNGGGEWASRQLGAVFVIAAYLVSWAAVSGCDSLPAPHRASGGALPEQTQIAFIAMAGGDPRWPAIEHAARRFAAPLNKVTLEFYVPADDTNASKSRADRAALAIKPHAICVCVDDTPDDAARVRELSRDGAFVITVGARIESAEIAARVIVDWAEASELLGAQLAAIGEGKRSYVLLHENGRNATATRAYERFQDRARNQAGMTLLEERNAADMFVSSRNPVREMLARFPHTGLVVTLSPAVWLREAATDVLASENRFATLGTAPALWPALRTRRAAALVGPIDGEIGTAAMNLAIRALSEKRRLDTERIIAFEVVTPEKIDDFAARYEAAAR